MSRPRWDQGYDDVLIEIGDFRIVKEYEGDDQSAIVQHHCNNRLKTSGLYCDTKAGWYYCWEGERECMGCAAPTSDEITGLHVLYQWGLS